MRFGTVEEAELEFVLPPGELRVLAVEA